mgnify:CR=1 FL=1
MKHLDYSIDDIKINIKKNKKSMVSVIETKDLVKERFFASSILPLEKVMANSKNNAIIYAKSVAGLDNGKERFFAIVTFFALFGNTHKQLMQNTTQIFLSNI